MAGFIVKVESSNRVWYLLGTIVFLLLGLALAVVGFTGMGTTSGVAGIIIAAVSVLFMIDAIMNM